ncbi:MAG: hypothetical protein UH850_13460 [Paludibacteraceae bacterium]|nr:hypothetical protein [Paludibacteraceae bacterium]
MGKKILTILLLSGCLLGANAEKKYMTVEQKDGAMYSFSLDENPIVTLESGCLVVNGNTTTSYAISEIKNYHFTKENETGTNTPSTKMLQIVSLDEASLQVQNAQASEKVTLIDANGIVLFSDTTDSEGRVIVKIPQEKGVYVLTTGVNSIKIIRK